MRGVFVCWLSLFSAIVLVTAPSASQDSPIPTSTVRVSPARNPSVIYEGRSVNGLWKSTDGGKSFLPINQGLSNPYPFTIAISPNDDELIFAGCSHHDSFPTLFKSTDGGGHWASVPPFHTILVTITMINFG